MNKYKLNVHTFMVPVAAAIFCISSTLCAQVKSATITGVVTDSSGAVLPEADVTITDQGTGISVTTKSTKSGDYTVPYLIAGTYSIQVTKLGFGTTTESGVAVTENASARVDIVMKVGQASTNVQVNAGQVTLQTEDPSVQSAVDERTIDALPNISENPLIYATLQPGVVAEKSAEDTTSTDSFGIGPHSRRALSMISINGGLGLTNDIQLDGVPILASDYNEEGISPNQEGLQEVRAQTNTFMAEYGRGTGIIQYSTKSGTNDMHGSAVYRVRNEAFNANGFANNFNQVPRGAYKVDYYGGSLGGPILKDKLFYFGSFEGLYHTQPVNFLLTVPTNLERVGNFSQTVIAGNNNTVVPVQLYNPLSVTPVPGASNTYQRALVPNATLTGPLLDPVGLKAYSNFPLANRPAEDVFGDNNFLVTKPQIYHRYSGQLRVDYRQGNQSFYGSGGIARGDIGVPQPFGPDNPFYPPQTWGQTITDDNPYAQVGDTVIFSPTLVLDVRYGINRMQSVEGYGPKSTVFDTSGYDIPANILALAPDPTEPFDFCPEGKYSCLNYTVGQHINEHQTNHSFAASITKIKSAWTFKAGAEYRVGLMNTNAPNIANFEIGNRWANQNYTEQYIDANGNPISALMPNPQQQGFQPAQYMMGLGYLVAENSVASALAMKYTALYSQNDWKVNSKLTLNMGVRWEVQPGPTERFNRQSAFDLQGHNPFGGVGAYAFSGANGYGRNLYATHFKDFGPRFGAEYLLRDNTVIRGGIGMAYLPTNTGFGFTSQNNGSFVTHNVQNYTAVFGPNPDGVPVGKFYSPQVNILVPAIGNNVSNPQLYGGSNSYYPDYHNTLDGRILQWDVFLERTFAKSWVASLGYSASRGDQMPFSNVPINGGGANGTGSTPAGYQTIAPATLANWRQQYIASNGTITPATNLVANPYYKLGFQGGALSNSTVQQWRLDVPYPEYPDLNVSESNAVSNYQSLIAEIAHTYSSGLEINANYVWSKEIDDMQNIGQSNDAFNNAGEQNTGYLLDLHNPALNRHVGYNDVPQRLVVTALYESPFGHGKRFFTGSGLADEVLGGWRLGGSLRAAGGPPIEITSSMGSLNNRPNRIPGVNPMLPKQYQHWYGGTPQNITVQGPNGPVTISSCTDCYEVLNPLAFGGPTVTTPNGTVVPDVFWYGDASQAYSDIRSKGTVNFDTQLQRDFRITERVRFQLAANVFNVLNKTNFQPAQAWSVGGIQVNAPGSANNQGNVPIGSATGSGSYGLNFFDPRQMQLQGRIVF